MILTENKNTIHFKQRLLPNCLPHDPELVTVDEGESTSQYHTPLTVAKFTGKREKIKSGYFIATPCTKASFSSSHTGCAVHRVLNLKGTKKVIM